MHTDFIAQNRFITYNISVTTAANTSYLHFSANAKFLYAVNELGLTDSSISAYRINTDYSLELLNKELTQGAAPCHICTDKQNRLLFSANSNSGSISVFSINPDGSLQMISDLIQHSGEGYNPERQEGQIWWRPSFTGSPSIRGLYVFNLRIS